MIDYQAVAEVTMYTVEDEGAPSRQAVRSCVRYSNDYEGEYSVWTDVWYCTQIAVLSRKYGFTSHQDN